MDKFAIDFDLNWFLTIPGMLISGGVLLLLIALIIFIATSGSGKKKVKEDVNTNVEPIPTKEEQVVEPNPQEIMTNPINNINEMNGTNVVPEVQDSVIPEVTPIMEPIVSVTPAVEVPAVMMEMSTQVIDNVVDENNNNTLPIQIDEPVVPVAPVIPAMETPVYIPKANEVNTAPSVSIYGGVSPIVPEMNTMQTERTIYGGADPLAATQSLPIVEQHYEYGVPVEVPKVEEKIVESVVTNEQPLPIMPEVAPIMDTISTTVTPEVVVEPFTEELTPNMEDDIEVLDF